MKTILLIMIGFVVGGCVVKRISFMYILIMLIYVTALVCLEFLGFGDVKDF
ncbi:MAG: hypothetical protein PF692_01870 [Kiritimatiellae bacterium]|jgi:hypothetical protein|nr:hypothetical protein [Kiritimatiellia bacterium]